jgi:serine/threonine protein kinase
MGEPPSDHPPDEVLLSYGNGKLDETIADAIGAHVDSCPACLAKVARLGSDSFVGKVRRAQGQEFGQETHLNQTEGAPPATEGPPTELAGLIDYQIVRRLDAGGMGVIYLARNILMDRDEVLKVMGAKLIERPGAMERFQSEIRVAARMRHPNIVTAYRAFRSGNLLIFAMEYVEGTDLAKIVKGRMATGKGPLPVSNSCYYIHQAALALQHAHEQGTVHRDIKPANLMLAQKESLPIIKVLDFGLSKATFETTALEPERPTKNLLVHTDGGLTIVGQMLGTPEYIAPEQIADAQSADIRADIYSLGCTLYFLLTGRPPFRASTLWDMLEAHKSGSAEGLNFVRTEVPTELAALVAKMMAKEPARRFQTPAEVAAALHPFFKKKTDPVPTPVPAIAAAAAPEAPQSVPTELLEIAVDEHEAPMEPRPALPPWNWRRDWKWVAAGVGSIAVGVAALALLLSHPGLKWGGYVRDAESQPPALPEGTPRAESRVLSTSHESPAPPLLPLEEIAPSTPPEMSLATYVLRVSPLGEQVDRSIRDGVRFLEAQQLPDGSWEDANKQAVTGTTSLVMLALLSAGEKPDSRPVRKALGFLRRFGPEQLNSTYAIALQTMVFAAAEPERDTLRIAANVIWLQAAQLREGDPVPWPGSWTYSSSKRAQPGDNSNTQYALLGLNAAAEAGVPVKDEVWALARAYWERCQKKDGSWAYTLDSAASNASMTCAGISSLVITGLKRYQSLESLQEKTIVDCGMGGVSIPLQRAVDWQASHFYVGQNYGLGQQWKFYYLYGLERAGRLAGIRFFGEHDWYREGAEQLVHEHNRLSGFWQGLTVEADKVVATSFALLFLAKGRAPVLVAKLRHGPSGDWNNDPDDVRNLVNIVTRDRKTLLTWQVLDPAVSSVDDLLQAPILFFNGHTAPTFNAIAKKNLRWYVERGGFIFADACCSNPQTGSGFDTGFRDLMKELFPEEQYKLRPLGKDHPVWRARSRLIADVYPLWGIEHGGRTAVIYSRSDLSCYWNQAERSLFNTDVLLATTVGQNIVEYAAGKAPLADKLSFREVQPLDPNFVAGHTPQATATGGPR